MKSRRWLLALAVAGGCTAHARNALPPETAFSAEGAKDQYPRYSPDGSRIAWWATNTDTTAGSTLWVANADGTSPVKVMSGGGNQFWSPDGSQLEASSTGFGAVHVVVVPAAGGTSRRLTTSAGAEEATGWNPDGDRVTFTATTKEASVASFEVSLKTGAIAPMVPAEHRPYIAFLSPDGRHVAYNVFGRGSSTIWVADSGGGNPRQLTTEGFEGFSGIRTATPWSPDGKEILYESYRTGTNDLWVTPIDGGPRRQLTRDIRNDQNGVWSPDGRWVAFRSDRGRQWNVWVVSAAGGEARRVTNDPEDEYALAWRPRSHTLSFVRQTRASSIWAMDLATGAERRLSPDSVRTNGFFLSPDGSLVSYVVDLGGGIQELEVVPLAGGASRMLVPPVGGIGNYLWSPDGRKIAFLSDRGGFQHVWVVDVGGGPARALASWASTEYSLFWNQDGSRVYFVSDRDSRLEDIWSVPVAGGAPQRVTTDGRVNSITGRTGGMDLFASTLSQRGGQQAIERLRRDGRWNVVWDRTNANTVYGGTSPSGDSLIASVEQPGGEMRSMIIAANGGGGRVILAPHETAHFWTKDGKLISYQLVDGGETDIGVYDVASGTERRLMHTPENEGGEEISRDGKTLVFNRTRSSTRIYTVDLTKLLVTPPK